MLNPDYNRYKSLYQINNLSFKTQTDLINSQYIQEICPPFPSFLDAKNKRGSENYFRYLNLGSYTAYPQICLDGALGIVNKELPSVKLPNNLSDLEYYATEQGTNLVVIQNQIMESIFKYGLAGLKVNIPQGVSIADALPKFEVIPGEKIVDYATYIDINGEKQYQYILIDTSRYLFNIDTKNYSYNKLFKICALDGNKEYYEAEIPQNAWTTFNLDNPESNKTIISYYKPVWTNTLNFVPFVAINKLDTTLKYDTAFVQDIISLSLENYRLTCLLGWLEQNCAASHLVIKGSNLEDASDYPIGAGAVHVLCDDNSQEYYVTPSTQGIAEIKAHINENNDLIQNQMYTLLDAAANSSGESLKFRIAVKCADLVALIKNIGNAITLGLELIDDIVNNGGNKDQIEFIPYTDFDKISTYVRNRIGRS